MTNGTYLDPSVLLSALSARLVVTRLSSLRVVVGAVHIKDVVLDGHNRQGMSVCGGMINLTVEDSVFSNTAGHAPACEHHNDFFRWP